MADASEPVRTINGDDLCNASFWRSFAKELHVAALAPAELTQPQQSYDRLDRRMAHDGYFADADVRLQTLAPAIGRVVKTLVNYSLPPVLIWIYDEPWECFRRLAPVIGHFLGPEYKALPAFWAWHVDPCKGESGWRPHRDNVTGLAADGSPLSLTCWIPLSEATPLNGCMYIVPAYLDPNYNRPEAKNVVVPQISRAIPAKPGDFLIWNQAVLHWGSLTSEFGDQPRMSMALEFQRGDIAPFQRPLLAQTQPPPFADRVRLIAHQILQYTHMYGVPQKHVQLAQYLSAASLNSG